MRCPHLGTHDCRATLISLGQLNVAVVFSSQETIAKWDIYNDMFNLDYRHCNPIEFKYFDTVA